MLLSVELHQFGYLEYLGYVLQLISENMKMLLLPVRTFYIKYTLKHKKCFIPEKEST